METWRNLWGKKNREGNDAADVLAEERRQEHMPPKSDVMKTEMQRAYVHDFLIMWAKIVIRQGEATLPMDKTPRVEKDFASKERFSRKKEKLRKSTKEW